MPLLERPVVMAAAVVYLIVVVAIGLWSARRTRTPRDFFVAGQSLGLWVVALGTMSAAFSGFVFVGGPGLTYRMGAASFFIFLPLGFTAALLCWSVGKRLRLLSEVRPVWTVPDAILCRYGSRTASGLAAVAVLLGTVAYLGAQLQALGVVIESIFGLRAVLGGWGLPVAMAVGLGVVVLYATIGGMVAGAYTDWVQGMVMLAAAGGVVVCALRVAGGPTGIVRSIVESPRFGAGFLDPLGGAPALTAVGFFFVFGVGTLGQPQMLHKFYMLKDPRQLRWLPALLGGSQAVAVMLWISVGLAVPALVAQGRLAPLADPDQAAPLFLLEFAPQLLAGLVFAGILAAIMSTADSLVNIAAAALVRDLPRALGRPPAQRLTAGRIAVVGVATAAALVAWLYGDLIALLGTFAFGTFGAALAPALAVGLNWRGVTARAASASIGVGTALSVGLEILSRQSSLGGLSNIGLAPGVQPAAVALAGSLAVLLLVSWGSRGRRQEIAADVALALEL